ncbi:MAG: SEL1-like repeat protein [Bacteroidales bacterium]|nr:SEL1-like repeat protein [Bacteroidales bacterium]
MKRVLLTCLILNCLNVCCQSTDNEFAKKRFEKLYYMCTNYDMDMSKRDSAFAAICALGDSGDTYSQEFLGCYYIGLKGKENKHLIEKGIDFCRKSLSRGAYHVGSCMADFYYKKGDIEMYIDILNKTIDNDVSKTELGYFLIFGTSLYSNIGNSDKVYYRNLINTDRGVSLVKKASENNVFEAMYHMGLLYYDGIVFDKNLKLAKEYFLRCKNHEFFEGSYWQDDIEYFLEEKQ